MAVAGAASSAPATASRSRSDAWPWALALGLICVVGLALRVANIDQSLFGDELYTYDDVVPSDSLGGVFDAVRHGFEANPPLYFVLAWLAAKLGDPTVWLRVPSLVAGVAIIPVVYALSVRTIGRWPGVVAAGLIALSPFAIFYSTEARAYSVMAFFVALSTLALVAALATRRRSWWIDAHLRRPRPFTRTTPQFS